MHDFYKNKKVFITGHTGFKGSWLALWLETIGAEVAGYSLPAEKLSHFNLLNLKTKNYFNDINDYKSLRTALSEFAPDIVFHLAAQPIVRESYVNPIETFESNLMGSLKVYSASQEAKVKAIVSITTDKVYENKEVLEGYIESSELGGFDPYSSSKACVEIMTNSFRRSFLENSNLLIATARAGNSIGGGDWGRDRLIPDLVKNASCKQITKIRNPNSIRPWQHVLDPLNGYLLLGEKLLQGNPEYASAFNFGPKANDNLSVEKISNLSSEFWNDIKAKFEKHNLEKHEAKILVLNTFKSKKMLNWSPKWGIKEATEKTIEWYRNYYINNEITSRNCLAQFISPKN